MSTFSWVSNKPIWLTLPLLFLLLLLSNRSATGQDAPDVESSVIASKLNDPTDFSVSPDGKFVFIAERGAKQIRRVTEDSDEAVVTQIGSDDEVAKSIHVLAIDSQKLLVGVEGFSDPLHSISLFSIPGNVSTPLDFLQESSPTQRAYERLLERSEAFDVIKLLSTRSGTSFLFNSKENGSGFSELTLKENKLNSIGDIYDAEMAKRMDLSTVAIDSLGGYFAAVGPNKNTPGKEKELVFANGDGKILQSFKLDLDNVRSLAFAPASHRLFALVGGRQSTQQSAEEGIFEILSKGDVCQTKLVLALDAPEKMKFDSLGNAWILCKSGDNDSTGLLRKITGLDTASPRANQ